jgi:hypothetical protein
MAAGTKDDEPDPEHPDGPSELSVWPESQDMVTQQSAANEQFKQHSEQLNANRAPDAALDAPKPEHQNRGSYNDLKQEHAEAVNRKTEEPKRDTGEQQLHFVKDAGRPNRASLKQEHADAAREEPGEKSKQRSGEGEQKALHFVKDGPRPDRAKLKREDAERSPKPEERKQEEPTRALHFVKDRNRGPDLGR